MAQWGVSVYLGTEELQQRLPDFLQTVAALGGSDIFTSLHIPETPLSDAVAQLAELTGAAGRHGLQVAADIGPGALDGMGASPDNLSPLQEMGLAGVRLDYGFSPEEIARFTRAQAGLRVVLNTSTIDPAFLEAVMASGANAERLESCHNYYPRPETGLSTVSFLRSSQVFKRFGLKVAAFVPGTGARRGPLFEGLPTIERHRNMESGRAAAELLATGVVDSVIFGDPWPTRLDLERVSGIAREEGVVLRVRLADGLGAFERGIVVGPVQENRPDAAEMVLRSTASRAYAAQGPVIEPFNTVHRKAGAVTIDNQNYLRYSGELQITIVDRPADPRVNVVARVIDEDLPLLAWVGPGQKFKLVPVA